MRDIFVWVYCEVIYIIKATIFPGMYIKKKWIYNNTNDEK